MHARAHARPTRTRKRTHTTRAPTRRIHTHTRPHTPPQAAEELKATNEELEKKIEFLHHHEHEILGSKESADADVVKMKKEVKKKVAEVSAISKRRDRAEADAEKMARLKEEAERYKNWLKDEMKNVLKSVENQRKDGETDEKLIKELQQQVELADDS